MWERPEAPALVLRDFHPISSATDRYLLLATIFLLVPGLFLIVAVASGDWTLWVAFAVAVVVFGLLAFLAKQSSLTSPSV